MRSSIRSSRVAMLRQTAIPVPMTATIVGSWATKASIEQDGSTRADREQRGCFRLGRHIN